MFLNLKILIALTTSTIENLDNDKTIIFIEIRSEEMGLLTRYHFIATNTQYY